MSGQAAAVCADTDQPPKQRASGCQPFAAIMMDSCSCRAYWGWQKSTGEEHTIALSGGSREIMRDNGLSHYHEAFDCGAPLQISSVQARGCHSTCRVSQRHSSLLLLPAAIKSLHPACLCLWHHHEGPSQLPGEKLQCNKQVCNGLFPLWCCLTRKEGKISAQDLGQMQSRVGLWKPAHMLWAQSKGNELSCCGTLVLLLLGASPELQLLQCHWINSHWVNFTALITKYYCT